MISNDVTNALLRSAFYVHRANIYLDPQILDGRERSGDLLCPVSAVPVNAALLRVRQRQGQQQYRNEFRELPQYLPSVLSSHSHPQPSFFLSSSIKFWKLGQHNTSLRPNVLILIALCELF